MMSLLWLSWSVMFEQNTAAFQKKVSHQRNGILKNSYRGSYFKDVSGGGEIKGFMKRGLIHVNPCISMVMGLVNSNTLRCLLRRWLPHLTGQTKETCCQ